MAATAGYLAGFLFCFLGLINSGDGIKCWECNTERDYSCRDPFDPTRFGLVDCDLKYGRNSYLQSYSVCRKNIYRVNGVLQIERSCAWEQSHDPNRPCTSLRATPYSTVDHCSTCRMDACNGASAVLPPAAMGLTLLAYMGVKYL